MVYENKFIITTKLPIDRLWTIISDTSRMNKAMGLPAWDEADLNGSRVVRTKMLGLEQVWTESPWTWILNQEIHQERSYQKGLMHKQTGLFRILPKKNGEDFNQVEVFFRWYGGPLLKFIIGPMSAQFLKKAMSTYIKTQETLFFSNLKAANTTQLPLRELKIEDLQLIDQILKESCSTNTQLLTKILQYLIASDDLDIFKINPKKIATDLNLPMTDVISQLTTLTKCGYLAITWDIVCPHCRGPQIQASKLQKITESTLCKTCDLEFSTQTRQSIEVTFKPQSKFRKMGSITYCAAEPAKKPHILLNWPTQQINALKLDLPAGYYRARTLKTKKECEIQIKNQSEAQQKLTLDFLSSQITLPSGHFELTYPQTDHDFLVIESLAWSNDKFLAGEALSNPDIRELVNDDLLSSGVKLDVGEQIILFTDIVGSTPMYKQLGDSKAFVAVQDHFAQIENIVKSNNGVVVKFIGDAVMAAFTDATEAFKANQEIHAAFKNNKNSLVLRTSFHSGQTLCVNLNVGLDYFGQTVNTAAKLQGWANGFETAVSEQTLKKVTEKQRSNLSIKKSGFDDKLQEQVLVF